jgi:hypothetical protein
MAKAAAQASAGKAPPKGKGQAAARSRSRAPKRWVKILAVVILFPFAAVLLPTTLVFFVMMAPTWVAYITDRARDKSLAVTVGMLNFAGTLPAIIELWTRGQSHQMAMTLITDLFVWVVAYGAAFGGWMIFAFMPTVVGSYYRMTTDARMKGLVKQQKALIAEWGHAVTDGTGRVMPHEADDGEEDAEAVEDDDGSVVTEAELVQPSRAR